MKNLGRPNYKIRCRKCGIPRLKGTEINELKSQCKFCKEKGKDIIDKTVYKKLLLDSILTVYKNGNYGAIGALSKNFQKFVGQKVRVRVFSK